MTSFHLKELNPPGTVRKSCKQHVCTRKRPLQQNANGHEHSSRLLKPSSISVICLDCRQHTNTVICKLAVKWLIWKPDCYWPEVSRRHLRCLGHSCLHTSDGLFIKWSKGSSRQVILLYSIVLYTIRVCQHSFRVINRKIAQAMMENMVAQ